jgi:hypothetical protein
MAAFAVLPCNLLTTSQVGVVAEGCIYIQYLRCFYGSKLLTATKPPMDKKSLSVSLKASPRKGEFLNQRSEKS